MEQLPPPVPALRDRIEDRLRREVDARAARLTAMHADLDQLGGELAGFVLAPGKRLRPLLVALGALAGRIDDVADAIGPAVGVELVHTCALVHDDLMDRATTRRGRPSAHRAFAAHHRRAGWPGDADHFGVAAALLLGDLAHVLADELFLDTSLPTTDVLRAFRRFTTMREEVTAGQYLDVLAAQRPTVSAEEALAVADHKSGLYSVARPLEIGALLAGDADLATGLATAGRPLGVAFQLRDDVLGVFGAEGETGKSARSDLAEGKRTYLVAVTLARLEDDERRRFLDHLGDPQLDAEGAGLLRDLMRGSGGLAATEQRIGSLLDEALRRLDALALPSAVDGALRAFAGYLTRRAA